jgi:hypothetical protein
MIRPAKHRFQTNYRGGHRRELADTISSLQAAWRQNSKAVCPPGKAAAERGCELRAKSVQRPKEVGMTEDIFISRSAKKPVQRKVRWIFRVLLALALPLGLADCKPSENKPAPETQETSASNPNAAKVVKDFGPALLRIGERWELNGRWIAPAGKHGFIDTDGHVVIKPQWDDVRDHDRGFEEGVALVKQNGKWGLIDKTGRFLSEPQWENKGEPRFEGGFAAVRRGKKWALSIEPVAR